MKTQVDDYKNMLEILSSIEKQASIVQKLKEGSEEYLREIRTLHSEYRMYVAKKMRADELKSESYAQLGYDGKSLGLMPLEARDSRLKQLANRRRHRRAY